MTPHPVSDRRGGRRRVTRRALTLAALAASALAACAVAHTPSLRPPAQPMASAPEPPPTPATTAATIPTERHPKDATRRPSRGTPAPLDPEALTGRIVFAHGGDIWAIDADGSDRTRITDHPAEEFDPVWSPRGDRIAYRSHRNGNEDVYIVDADGSDQRDLTAHPASDYSPAWSPDGSLIAFASDRDRDSGGNDIYTVRPDGTGLRRITSGGGIDEYPSWSPDGSRIAYACTGGRVLEDGVGDFEVCTIALDGSDRRQISDAPGVSDHPAWSPDERSIAFMSTRGGWPTLPDYVPPGFEAGTFGEYDVYVMAADGSDVRNVTRNGREDEQFPAWSPDGRLLVFSRYGCLVASSSDGTSEAGITRGECSDGFPDWHR